MPGEGVGGMRNADCGMRNADCGMRNADCGIWRPSVGRVARSHLRHARRVTSVRQAGDRPQQCGGPEGAKT